MNLQSLAENFYNQLLTLQTHIATREENPNLPTVAEVNMQVRLFSAVDRLTKAVARQQKEAEKQDVHATIQPAKKATEVPLPSTPQRGDPQPFSNGVFEEYRSVLREFSSIKNEDETIFVRGAEVNTWWFIYALFQYCQPQQNRCYINDVQVFFDTVDLEDLKQQIAIFLDLVEAA